MKNKINVKKITFYVKKPLGTMLKINYDDDHITDMYCIERNSDYFLSFNVVLDKAMSKKEFCEIFNINNVSIDDNIIKKIKYF